MYTDEIPTSFSITSLPLSLRPRVLQFHPGPFSAGPICPSYHLSSTATSAVRPLRRQSTENLLGRRVRRLARSFRTVEHTSSPDPTSPAHSALVCKQINAGRGRRGRAVSRPAPTARRHRRDRCDGSGATAAITARPAGWQRAPDALQCVGFGARWKTS